jgi:hypothetical protein
MRISLMLGLTVALTATLAIAAPAVSPSPSTPAAADQVAATLVRLVDAAAHGDAKTIRAIVKLPLNITWMANSGGECSAPRNKTLTDPLAAAKALASDKDFVAALRRDKGHAHAGAGCADESSKKQFTAGDPAITVTGDQATVTYLTPACEAGAPTYTFTLRRIGGAWQIVGYDSGCHYDES